MMTGIEKICLFAGSDMLQAIKCLNASGLGIVLVCNDDRALLGTVTDADIRKALADGLTLSAPIESIMNSDPVCVLATAQHKALLLEFQRTGLSALPAIDEKGCIINCFFRNDFVSVKPFVNTIVIMAGGFGKRLGKLTKDIPKPLLKVDGKPMIQHIIELAACEGFNDVVVTTHHLADSIENFCGDGSQFGVNIRYIREEEPLGTGGSFGMLENVVGPVVVTNSDIISDVGYRQMVEFHCKHRASVTIAVREHQITHPFGVVLNEGIVFSGIQEKPTWTTNINAGIYVLEASLQRLVTPGKAVDMPSILERCRKANEKVIIYPLHERWIDLGSVSEYKKHR